MTEQPPAAQRTRGIRFRTAAELMTRNPILIAPTATLRAAAVMMSQQKLRCLLVPGEEERCVGVITLRDIALLLCDEDVEILDNLQVADVMTSPAITVQENFCIEDCLRLMRTTGVRSMPVLRGLVPVGVLSLTDVLTAALGSEATPLTSVD